MIKHPVYLAWSLLWAAYLSLASLRGWSVARTVSPASWLPGISQPGISHK
jgi:hypothetical protein